MQRDCNYELCLDTARVYVQGLHAMALSVCTHYCYADLLQYVCVQTRGGCVAQLKLSAALS